MEVVGSSTTTIQLRDKEDKQSKAKKKCIIKSTNILKNHNGRSRSKEVVRRRWKGWFSPDLGKRQKKTLAITKKWRSWVVQPPPFSSMVRKINKTRGKPTASSNL
jgi:hypothetical protein